MDTTPEQPGSAAAPDGGGSRPRVVVGVDGSPGSWAALVHALITAARRGADLDVVSSYAIELYYLGGAPLDVPDLTGVRDDTHDRVTDLVEEVRVESAVASVPGIADVTVRLVVSEGPAVQALVDRAEGAELLVIGSRGRGAMRSALLGSVALHCATHAPCPVLVVHPVPAGSTPSGRVVVGVDGSPASREALAAAVAEAGRTGAEVEAVDLAQRVAAREGGLGLRSGQTGHGRTAAAGFKLLQPGPDLLNAPLHVLRREVRQRIRRRIQEQHKLGHILSSRAVCSGRLSASGYFLRSSSKLAL